MDGDPKEKLFLSNIDGTGLRFISNGATHPLFLGKDSLAFSHYSHGRQGLAICRMGPTQPECREERPEALTGFYALSRSAGGILLNATDTSGRTGIFEYRWEGGFVPVLRDSTAEFPVEAEDGSVLVLRDRAGLLQVDRVDRQTNVSVPAATYPLGTFYLYRAGPGIVASVAQSGAPGKWSLQPVPVPEQLATPTAPDTGLALVVPDSSQGADSTQKDSSLTLVKADTVAIYRKPGFLASRMPEFPTAKHEDSSPARSYYSLLGVRPLIAAPFIASTFDGVATGANAFLQDPLQLHTLNLMGGLGRDRNLYGISYFNQQTSLGLDFSATNDYLDVEEIRPADGWTDMLLVTTATVLSAGITIPLPGDMPLGHSYSMGMRLTSYSKEYRFAGSFIGGSPELLDTWVRKREDIQWQLFAGYEYSVPYAFQMVHPLKAMAFELGVLHKSYGTDPFWYARVTAPLLAELTFTVRFEGINYDEDAHVDEGILPGPVTQEYFWGGRNKVEKDIYASFDFPFRKGYIGELPILGLWNYLGASLFGSYHGEDGEEQIVDRKYVIYADSRSTKLAGAKLNGLFHVMRRAPLVISLAYAYDFGQARPVFRLQTEFSGIPSRLSLTPKFTPGLGDARRRAL
jgi:hypothetical protein